MEKINLVKQNIIFICHVGGKIEQKLKEDTLLKEVILFAGQFSKEF